jgi:catechol 2,3-dioxygenase
LNPPTLTFSTVRLRVRSLVASLAFYRGTLGFVSVGLEKDGALAASSGAPAILFLEESAEAAPTPAHAAGLFHAALLFPGRAELGRWLRFAAERRLSFEGFSDHGVSEAIYFSDPDGNGLEFYADRPKESWPRDGTRIAMVTEALDLDHLVAAAAPDTREPLTGAAWGHLHLRVTNLDRAQAFYSPRLGMELRQGSIPSARFLAADGYHHHLGINTWGRPTHPQPKGGLGLVEATFRKKGATPSLEHDPDGIAVRIEAL